MKTLHSHLLFLTFTFWAAVNTIWVLTCTPPPAVECQGGGCTIFNFEGIWEDRSPCSAADAVWPSTEKELVHAVARAVQNKQKIRVVGPLAHSLTRLVCVGEGGLIISTKNYSSTFHVDKSAMTISVDAGAAMRDVIDEAAKEGLALPAMIYWDGASAGGVVSTGAHGSGLFGRGSAVYEYVVQIRLVVPASPSEGYAKVVTLREGDPDFKAAVFSLGTLGAISQITFALQPMFKRSVSYSLEDDADLEFRAEDFMRAHEFGDVFWYLGHRKARFGRIERVPVETPGDGVLKIRSFQPLRVVDVEKMAAATIGIQDREDADESCRITGEAMNSTVSGGSGFLNDGVRFTGYPVIGFNNLMQTAGGCQDYFHKYEYNRNCTPTKILDPNLSVCRWDRRAGSTFYFDVEIRIPLSQIGAAIADLRKLRDLNPKAMCEIDAVGIEFRTIKKSDAYLGRPEDVVTLEFLYYRPRQPLTPKWNEDVYEEMEQLLIEKYGGTLHWAKSGGFLFQGLAERSVSLEKFLSVREKFDPDGFFSNDWTDGLLGIGGKGVEELREGCALDKMCKCRVDSHCAPTKHYFCKSGRLWKRARVCRKAP